MDEIKKKEATKARILDKFNEYMQAELKGNPTPDGKKRLNTIH
jgi:hypothetical protein